MMSVTGELSIALCLLQRQLTLELASINHESRARGWHRHLRTLEVQVSAIR